MAKRIKPAVGWGVNMSGRMSTAIFFTRGAATYEAEWTNADRDCKVIRVAIVPLADAVRAGLVTKKEARTK